MFGYKNYEIMDINTMIIKSFQSFPSWSTERRRTSGNECCYDYNQEQVVLGACRLTTTWWQAPSEWELARVPNVINWMSASLSYCFCRMQSSAPLSTFQMIATSNSSRSYFLLVSTAYAVVGKTKLYIPKKRLKERLYILYFGSKEEKISQQWLFRSYGNLHSLL